MTNTNTTDLAKAVAALADKAGDIGMGILFPMPHFTPARQKKAVLEAGREAYALMQEAEAVGDTKVAKKAREIALHMKDKLDLLAERGKRAA